MDNVQQFLQSLNPSKDEQAILIYGSEYKLWRDGKYLGIGTWTKDENVGDSFQATEVDEDGIIYKVFIADKWELVC